MFWTTVFYVGIVVAIFCLVIIFIWICIILCSREELLEILDDAASYISIPSGRTYSWGNQPMPYELATIRRESLRHRSYEHMSDREENTAVPYGSDSFIAENSSLCDSSGKGSSLEGSEVRHEKVRFKIGSSDETKTESSSNENEGNSARSEMGVDSDEAKKRDYSVSPIPELSDSKIEEDSSKVEDANENEIDPNSQDDSGVKLNASQGTVEDKSKE